jgi:hypothetical protein
MREIHAVGKPSHGWKSSCQPHTRSFRQPDGSSAPTPVVVWIDISEIEFK